MIQIKSLEITNYRSCVKTKIEINTSLTALIGVNGVGKSNILNSIQLLKRINRNRYFHYKEFQEALSSTNLKFKLLIDDVPYILKADIFYETDESNTDNIYSARLQYKKDSSQIRKWTEIDADLYQVLERFKYFKSTGNLKNYEKYVGPENSEIAVTIVEYLSNISYYSATQFSDPTKSPVSVELEDSRPSRNFKNRHDKFIFDLYLSHKTNGKAFKRYIDTVNMNGIGLIDNIEFYDHNMPSSSYKVKTGGKIQKIERTKNIIIPSVILDKLTLSPNQLSEGTFKTLALIYYILNDESELLLIEEPEVCVHHGLLSSIIELIKIQAKQKQIIISTHSDYVLDKLKPENILLITKDKGFGTSAKTLNKTLSKDEYSALKEYLGNSGNLGEYWKEGGFENE